MSKIFDSRDTEYKSPFGAAVCGVWSDTELGVGTALVAIAGPALVRSYLKGS